MTTDSAAGQFIRWRAAVEDALRSPADVLAWQDRRYQFAHRLGQLLTQPARPGGRPVDGHVLYGVTIAGAGLVYIGQSTDARRRLRDLPVGESHHLATTIPPEAWARVLVIEWPALLATIPDDEPRTASGLGYATCGLALEHHLQLACRPILSARRRGSAGTWSPRNLDSSRSRGAQACQQLPQLCHAVTAAWEALASVPAPASGPPVTCTRTGRVVFPQALL
jgi:hypothetical protein